MLQLFHLSKNDWGDHGGASHRRGTWHVFVRKELRAGLSWGNQKEGTNNLEEQGICGRIILEWIIK